MAERKYTHGLTISNSIDITVIDIGDMEIWDGADLSLIRDTLFRIVLQEGVDAFAVDMRAVQYVPSGFFGMLYDWMERGIEVNLIQPRKRVQRMLWFRKFFTEVAPGTYRLQESQIVDEAASEDLWRKPSPESLARCTVASR